MSSQGEKGSQQLFEPGSISEQDARLELKYKIERKVFLFPLVASPSRDASRYVCLQIETQVDKRGKKHFLDLLPYQMIQYLNHHRHHRCMGEMQEEEQELSIYEGKPDDRYQLWGIIKLLLFNYSYGKHKAQVPRKCKQCTKQRVKISLRQGVMPL